MASRSAGFVRFSRLSNVKFFNRLIEGDASRIHDGNMLESAINSPDNLEYYGGETDPARLAAALSSKLIKNHAFANGNKRTALLAANAYCLQYRKALRKSLIQPELNEPIKVAHEQVAIGSMEESDLAQIYREAWRDATPEEQKAAA